MCSAGPFCRVRLHHGHRGSGIERWAGKSGKAGESLGMGMYGFLQWVSASGSDTLEGPGPRKQWWQQGCRGLCDGLGQWWAVRLPSCLLGGPNVRRGLSREGLWGKNGVLWAGVGGDQTAEAGSTAVDVCTPVVPPVLKQGKGGWPLGTHAYRFLLRMLLGHLAPSLLLTGYTEEGTLI